MTTDKEINAAVSLICGYRKQLSRCQKNALLAAVGGRKLHDGLVDALNEMISYAAARADVDEDDYTEQGKAAFVKAHSAIAKARSGL